jgi:cobalamin-dependent methionine synthase I
LADRFAEALPNIYTSKLERIFGVYLMKTWEAMIDEVYKGIRPDQAIPCPDHLENLLFGNY